jgi:hypothetical protein
MKNRRVGAQRFGVLIGGDVKPLGTASIISICFFIERWMVPEELTTVARALVYFGFAFAIALSVPTFLNALREIRKFIRELMRHSE